MANPRDIRFDQRNATNTAYIETYVSGSNLILRTNDVGVVVGTTTIEGIPIGTLISSSGNFTNLSASNFYVSGTIETLNLSNLTASNISCSNNFIVNTITGSNGLFTDITSSNLTIVSSSNLNHLVANDATFNGLVSASAGLTSSFIYDTGQLVVLGNTTLQDTFLTNLTASNISASGFITSSTLNITGNSVLNTITGSLSGSDVYTGNAIIEGGTIDNTPIGTTNPSTGNFTNISSSAIYNTGQFTTLGNTIIGDDVNDIIQVTGSFGISGSFTFSGSTIISNLTANRVVYTDNNKVLSTDDDLIFDGTTLTATDINNINFTSSNISASGNVSSSTANINTITSNLINSVSGSFDNISASKITGGTTQLDTLSVLGNSTFYGDLTVYGSSSIVNISSSTVIIGDNRIQLNAWSTGSFSQRYAGLDLTDSGSNNNITSSLLWDSLNNYWVLTNNQSGPIPIVTSSALILQGPVSEFGSEKQLQQNNFLKVETTVGNLTSSNLYEVNNELKYNGTISSSAISASSAFFNLDVLINGVLKVFGKIYAYAGIIGDVTGSLSGSSIIVNTITASTITSSTIRTGDAQIDGGIINNTVIGNITPSTGNFTYITASVISSSTLISNNNTLVNVTSSNISASGYISASSANFINLSSVNNILTNVTSSNISASGYISSSTVIADTGSFVFFNINNTGSAPSSPFDSGKVGEIRFDNNFIYVYTNNRWVRSPISKWEDNISVEILFSMTVSSGSIIFIPTASLSRPVNSNILISFTKQFNVTSGSIISLSSSINIPQNELTGTTNITISGDSNRLTSGSSATNISYGNIYGYSLSTASDINYVNYLYTPSPLLTYSPSVNTLNWYTDVDYGGTSYTNVSLSNFADSNPSSSISISPSLVRSLSFNTSSGDANQITSISNLGSYKVLDSLDVHNQLLSSLDLSENIHLSKLDCSDNIINLLDLSGATQLTQLSCSFNELNNLNITQSTNLQKLYCSNNNLSSSLDLSNNTQLTIVDCSNNTIPYINLNNLTNLSELYCSNNEIVSASFSSLNALQILDCNDNSFSTINLSGSCPLLTTLKCNNQFNALTSIDLGEKPNLTYLSCTNNTNLTTLNLTGSLYLETLYLSFNPKLSSLDLTYNTLLKELYYNNSNMGSIDLLNNIDLEILDLSSNGISSLDIQNSDKLYVLNLSNNQLSSVTMSTYNNATSNTCSFDFSNNYLSSSAVNYILEILNGYNNLTGSLTVNLTGNNNQGPSDNGVTYMNNLINNGWSVLINTPFPIITSVSPSSGSIGDTIIISGSYLSGSTNVLFNNSISSFTVNSNSQITATVPTGSSTGKITVITPSGFTTSSGNFSIISLSPTITNFSPIAGVTGSTVTINGNYFTDVNAVLFNGISSSYTTINSSTITATVPSGSTTGKITISASLGSVTSSTDFTVISVPTITNFEPLTGSIGDIVSITGSAFNTVSNVLFNGISASYTLIDDSHITSTVPTGSSTGPITVLTAGGTGSSAGNFAVLIPVPTITSFSPISGSAGTTVVITGTNLTDTSAVYFRGITSSFVTVNSNTQVTADVPVGFTKSGTITIETPGGSATSSGEFVYVSPAVAPLEYTPTSSLMNWYTLENYGGTENIDVSLSTFQNTVTAADVRTIEFSDDANITSIINLSTYNNLKTLDVTFQNLSTLNLTGNTSIRQLYCDNNELTSLDLSNNNVITIISCDNNVLSSLNVDNMTSLATLSCIGSALPSLSLTTNTNLVDLKVNNNQLSSLNLSNNTSLLTADLSENLLTSINIDNNTALTSFKVGNNSLTSLTVSNNTALIDLNVESNNISSLNLSTLNNLNELYVSNNQLTTLDISNNSNLTSIYGAVNGMTSITMSNSVNVTTSYHIDLADNALTEASVNDILQKIDSYPTPSGTNMTDKWINLSGGTNASPSGDGLTAQTSLLAKGYTITTN